MKVTPIDKILWSGLGTWCVYQMAQALRCLYYVLLEPWAVEEDDDEG